MAPFYGWGSAALRLQSHFEGAVYFLPLSSQKFLVLILSTSERWKAGSTLESPSGFEQGASELAIQQIKLLLLLNVNTNVMLESPAEPKSYLIFPAIITLQQKKLKSGQYISSRCYVPGQCFFVSQQPQHFTWLLVFCG